MKVHSDSKSYFIGNISICILSISFAMLVIIGGAYKSSLGSFIFLMVESIILLLYGLKHVIGYLNKYIILHGDNIEIHDFKHISLYNKHQIKYIENTKIVGGRGSRYVYVINFNDGNKFQVTKDIMLEQLFQDFEVIDTAEYEL